MEIFIYGLWDKFELDDVYDLKEGKRKFFDTCDTENQEEVNNLIGELIDNEESVDLLELYEYLDKVTRGQISLESFLFAVDDYIEYLK